MNSVNIALAGNPNSGKTTLFNELTGAKQYVGNWPGVTVERKSGPYKKNDAVFFTDLPGTYSLSPYSPEEVVSHDFLTSGEPDAAIAVVDATNLERSLYLVTQIIDQNIPTVVALNMTDVIEKRGQSIDVAKLSESLGCPVTQVSALKNRGIDELISMAIDAAESHKAPQPKMDLGESSILYAADADQDQVEDFISNRYDQIAALCSSCVSKAPAKADISQKLDSILTNRILGIPLFIVIMFFVYYLAVSVGGGVVTDWANDSITGEGWWYGEEEASPFVPSFAVVLSGALEAAGAAPWVMSLLIDGIVGGVGAVLGFIPQLIILFLLLGFLELCGYMSRVAFMMDRIFRRFGLSGKSVIPMLIASGCGVPAVMSTKAIDNESERRLTVMTTTMIPCGAKMPIIALVFGALASGDYTETWWVAPLFYFMGVTAILVSCIILKKFSAFTSKESPFIMEMPEYRLPTVRSILLSTWERVKSYVVKAGTIIFLSTIVIWFLMNFGVMDGQFGMLDPEVEDYLSYSLIAAIGSGLGWIFAPLGFGDWGAAVTSITGLVAKENVVATVGIITSLTDFGEADPDLWQGFAAMLGGSTAAIMAFCAFNLLCAPCFAAIGTIRRQMNSAAWTWATIGYMCGFAWCVGLMVYQLGGLAMGEVAFNFWTVVALGVAAGLLFLLFRPASKKAAADVTLHDGVVAEGV